MSEAQKLMRDVIRAHAASSRRVAHPWRKGFLINVAACAGDGCDWVAPNEDVDHAEHVAAEIDTTLGGLTREYGATNDWRFGKVYSVLLGSQGSRERAEARIYRGVDLIGHWVSGWTLSK